MRIKPKANLVLVELVPTKKEKDFVTMAAPTYPVEAIVKVLTEDVIDFPPRYEVGDRVLIPEMKGFKFPSKELLRTRLINQADILAKIYE